MYRRLKGFTMFIILAALVVTCGITEHKSRPLPVLKRVSQIEIPDELDPFHEAGVIKWNY